MEPITGEKQLELYVTIWSKAIDTQMHFNEMSVKSRQFGLTFVAAALGLGVVLLSRGNEFLIPILFCGWGFDIHATVLIILAGAFALYAVRVLDLNVYHKMLRGAVTFGEDFESNYMRKLFDLQKGMTQAISHYSRYEDADVSIVAGRYEYQGKDQKSALQKIQKFYDYSIWSLLGSAALLFLITAHFGSP